MMNRSKAALATLAMIVVMLSAADTASANRLSINNETYRVIWNPMNFITRGGTRISCRVTLEGVNNRISSKLARGGIGFETSARIEGCSGGTIVFLTETLPWPITYESFTGTLPNIEQVLLSTDEMTFRWGSLSTCLYTVTFAAPQLMSWVRRLSTSQIILVNLLQSWISSPSFLCEAEDIRLSGTGAITREGGFEGVFVTLI
jgi:hypothetical protein